MEVLARRASTFLSRGVRDAGWPRSEVEEFKHVAPVEGESAERLGDAGPARQAQAADGEVAQARHRLGPVTDSNLRSVLIERHVAYPVETVLNLPLSAGEFPNPAGARLGLRAAGQAVGNLVTLLAALGELDRALDPEDLPDVREVEIVIEGCAGLDSAGLNAAVGLFDPDVRRGKKGCRRAPADPSPGWPGCPSR